MINNLADVTAEYPIQQVWKLLRSFLDVSSVSNAIRRLQNIPEGKQGSNVKKQATQIGYCVRQAEEYFHASSQVGLPTRPTLLYYGAVSLSRALVLLKKDGTYSFDALRKEDRHNHHGLDLARGLAAEARPAKGSAAFFRSLQCDLHFKGDALWGHFPLFYDSLVPSAFGLDAESRQAGKTIYIKSKIPVSCADVRPLHEIAKRRLDSLTLMKCLPDMFHDLRGNGIDPLLCCGSISAKTYHTYRTGEEGDEELDRTESTHDFFLDGLTRESKTKLLALYRDRNPKIELVGDLGTSMHLQLKLSYSPSDERPSGEYLDIVDDVADQKYYSIGCRRLYSRTSRASRVAVLPEHAGQVLPRHLDAGDRRECSDFRTDRFAAQCHP